MPAPVIKTASDGKTPVFSITAPSGAEALPTTTADGDNVTLGAKADAAASSDIGSFSLVALVKRLLQKLTAGLSVTVTASNLTDAGTVNLTTTAAQLNTNKACNLLLIQNDTNNTADILVGASSAQTIRLTPGQSMTLAVSNLNLVYAKGSTGTPVLNWFILG